MASKQKKSILRSIFCVNKRFLPFLFLLLRLLLIKVWVHLWAPPSIKVAFSAFFKGRGKKSVKWQFALRGQNNEVALKELKQSQTFFKVTSVERGAYN